MGLCPHIHFTPPWPFPPVQNVYCHKHNSNYSTTHIISMGSKLFPSVKYTFHSIYSNTSPSTKHNLWNNLFKHTLGEFMSTYPFQFSTGYFSPVQNILSQIETIQLHILFQWDQNYFLQSNILFTLYILTPVHPLNTSYIIIYLSTLWVGLCPHTHFTSPWPLLPVQNIMLQHDSNYSTTHIISMGSKLFPSVKYTFHSIYSNTSPSTKHNLHNNLFEHTLGEFMSTYPFYSSMAISPCPKNYITTQFKLFNYTYYFNGIKIISFSQIYFSLNIF